MWLDGGSYDTARLRGETTFERPPGPCEFDLKMILCPPDEKRPLASSRAVVLRATVSISHEGCCVLTFVAPYWLVNTSSLPLRVYNARDTADHMVEARHARRTRCCCTWEGHWIRALAGWVRSPAAPR